MSITVSGITPAQVSGNNILIDKSGSFTVCQSIIATIYLAGGGCDGERGYWYGNRIINGTATPILNSNTGDKSYSGAGGDGGYVNVITNVKIDENKPVSVKIAQSNDRTGTSITVNGITYYCNSTNDCREGGIGGEVPAAEASDTNGYSDPKKSKRPVKGYNGISTPFSFPYSYIGSSGGGGAACNGTETARAGIRGGICAGSGDSHRQNGTDAVGYGCGGGGGSICGNIAVYPTSGEYISANPSKTEADYESYGSKGWFFGGKGKQGCVIISYKEVPRYNLTVICNPAEGGNATVKGDTKNYVCDDTITIEAYEGDKFSVIPMAESRWRFVNVTSNDVGLLGKYHEFTMPAKNVTVYVNFIPLYYLTITCVDPNGGTAELKDNDGKRINDAAPELTIDAVEGDKFYLNPQYNSGYEFLGITSDDAEIVDGDRITMPAKDAVVIVHFEKIPVHEPVIPTEERPPESGKEPPKYVIQRRFKRNITKQDKRKDEYYSSSNKFNKCKLGSGCGCNTYNASDYTDTFHIGKH